jgi:hypothetical protein
LKTELPLIYISPLGRSLEARKPYSGTSLSYIFRLGRTPPTVFPDLSHLAEHVKHPAVSVRPYASKMGAENTTVKVFLTYNDNGAPPETKYRILPPRTALIALNIRLSKIK